MRACIVDSSGEKARSILTVEPPPSVSPLRMMIALSVVAARVALVHEAGITARRHRTPNDERAFFDQDDALAGGLKLACHGRAAGATANDQVIDRSGAMPDRFLLSVVDQLAGSDARRIQPGIDVGAIDEHGRREEGRQGLGKRQVPDRGEVGLSQDCRHLGRQGAGTPLEEEREEGCPELRVHPSEAAWRRDEGLHGRVG